MHGSTGGRWRSCVHGATEPTHPSGKPAGLSPSDLPTTDQPAAYLTDCAPRPNAVTGAAQSLMFLVLMARVDHGNRGTEPSFGSPVESYESNVRTIAISAGSSPLIADNEARRRRWSRRSAPRPQPAAVPGEFLRRLGGTLGMLTSMEERELLLSEDQPLIGWRLFRVRRSESRFVLSAPLIHSPDFERFPSRTIEAICYQAEHPAPAPGCRCGLYVAIDGTLDSLSGYLSDSAHDHDFPIYAEVACTGRVFVDLRGVRAQRIEVLRLATSASLWRDPGVEAQAVAELSERYGVEVCDLGVVPQWLVANVMPQGAPPEDAAIDLDALLESLGLR